MSEPQLIQRPSLVAIIVAAGVPTRAISCPDFTYALPSVNWLEGEFGDWAEGQMRVLGLRYTEDGWDCDDFSEWCRLWARVAHQRPTQRDDAIAVGWFDYMTTDFTGHSIVCAVCSETPDRLRFFEPQKRMKEMFLVPQEVQSCLDMRM